MAIAGGRASTVGGAWSRTREASRFAVQGASWLNRNRRLAKDFGASISTAQAWLFIASVQLLAGHRFQLLTERLGVVGDRLHPMSGMAGPDMPAFPRGRMRMVRLHDGDDVVDRASPECIALAWSIRRGCGSLPLNSGARLSSSRKESRFPQIERTSTVWLLTRPTGCRFESIRAAEAVGARPVTR